MLVTQPWMETNLVKFSILLISSAMTYVRNLMTNLPPRRIFRTTRQGAKLSLLISRSASTHLRKTLAASVRDLLRSIKMTLRHTKIFANVLIKTRRILPTSKTTSVVKHLKSLHPPVIETKICRTLPTWWQTCKKASPERKTRSTLNGSTMTF